MDSEKVLIPVVPPSWRRVCAAAALLVLACASAPHQAAAGNPALATSSDVKAQFLVNFLSFAEWPAAKLGQPPARLVIAVLGDPSFAALVEKVAEGHPVNGRAVA